MFSVQQLSYVFKIGDVGEFEGKIEKAVDQTELWLFFIQNPSFHK